MSMEVYADSLSAALALAGAEVSHFRPVSWLERKAQNRFVMRFLRYVSYPWQVRKNAADGALIQHVTDHGYAHLYPQLSATVKVCSAHDLIPLLSWKGIIETVLAPDGTPSDSRAAARKPVLNLHSLSFLDRFDHLITISEQSAADLVQYLGIDKQKISVVPPVIAAHYVPQAPDEIERVMAKYGLQMDRKWIMISGSEYYKNHRNSLLAIAQLIKRTKQKIGIFKSGWVTPEFAQMVEELGLSSYTVTSHIAGDDLPAIYSAVDCLSFPSLYEGFGMPVAEAAACGTPVVISDRGALKELNLGLFSNLDPFDTQAISCAIERALFDKPFREHIQHEGPQAVARFREAAVGQQCINLYRELLR
ncbi:mannosyltransferase [Arenicella chitinivorans]|uniref:Mannosyltransferase n=2 Tax=Arenicella chitinivorans TaxID=1329800 RepID=A0A918VMQ3_9GAMM|nr:mannosyltransferase [Arenicella chitinivorans]